MAKPTILITDAQCATCQGAVTGFLIPDKVWAALGLTTEWLCKGCVARRIHPKATAAQLETVIRTRRKQFHLKRYETYGGVEACVPFAGAVFELSSTDPEACGHTTMTKAQAMGKEVL